MSATSDYITEGAIKDGCDKLMNLTVLNKAMLRHPESLQDPPIGSHIS